MNAFLCTILLGIASVAAQLPQVATPLSIPSGRIFTSPLSVLLASITPGSTILYTTDGTAPAESVTATTKKYSGVILISATTSIKAIAVKAGQSNSAVMSESFVYSPPVSVERGHYLDVNGDGRIEAAVVIFDKDLPALPAKFGFSLRDGSGATVERITGPSEIAFAPESKTRVIVTFSDPFPFGLTSVANSATSGKTFAQSDIPLLDGAFAMQDSVPPVLIKAGFVPKSDSMPYDRVNAELSEDIWTVSDYGALIRFKREGAIVPESQVKVFISAGTGEKDFLIRFDSSSGYVPRDGDSAAFNADGAFRDLASNAPARPTFIPLTGNFHTSMVAASPRGPKGDLIYGGGTLSGRSLAQHPPSSIACYDVAGGLLGMAKPTVSSDVWELPAGKQAMVLILTMPDGTRRAVNIPIRP